MSDELYTTPDSFTVTKKIPPQATFAFTEEQIIVISDSAKSLITANLIVSFLFQNSLNIIFGSIIEIQILAHLPLANIQMPA